MIITPQEFEKVTGEKLLPEAWLFIKEASMAYEELTEDENASVRKEILTTLLSSLKISGENRAEDWELGWAQNLDSEIKSINDLVPRYMGKFPYVRWNNRFVKSITKDFEYCMLQALQLTLFEKWMKNSDNVYEFGCGTGHNLSRVRKINEKANLTGLDWATSSQQILSTVNEKNILKCSGKRFDFFSPDKEFCLKDKSTVYTFAALEQVGNKYQNFVKYLIDNNIEVCLSIEPVTELLDESFEIDRLSKEYCKKRGYLDGYLTHLRDLESQGIVKILEAKRNYIGSMYLEGYMQVAWKPMEKK